MHAETPSVTDRPTDVRDKKGEVMTGRGHISPATRLLTNPPTEFVVSGESLEVLEEELDESETSEDELVDDSSAALLDGDSQTGVSDARWYLAS